ncbi:HET-domain-containing protein [Podospora conica]|nr:HET-domain-containing protein [Schizothecium conicum]
MTLPDFQYAPLDLASDGIRLVRLMRGGWPDPIHCEILETYLRDIDYIPYEALSYCWGSNEKTSSIIMDNCHKPVTDNLFAALNRLRSQHLDRILWIDAICIDQDNKKEQGHQVAKMKRIYENAERVIAWLGDDGDDVERKMETDALMRIMAVLRDPDHKRTRMKFALQEGKTPKDRLHLMWPCVQARMGVDEYDDEICTGLARTLNTLLCRPWFRRTWIIQEVACARSLLIMCGSYEISSRVFVDFASLLGVPFDHQSQANALLDIMPGRRRKESWWNESRDLQTLLVKFQASEATDERDKVYALLGISSDASLRNAFPPDYEKPMHKVMQNTISFVLFRRLVDLDAYPLPVLEMPDIHWRQANNCAIVSLRAYEGEEFRQPRPQSQQRQRGPTLPTAVCQLESTWT